MISTKGRYGLRVMLDLAEHSEAGFVPLKDIAERQGISKKYLEIIMRDLVSGGLVAGASGKGGGYRLCREPGDYTAGEIIERMEGTLASVACLAGERFVCPRRDTCETLPLWTELDALVRDFLYSKRLTALLNPPEAPQQL
ncbi:MAG: Rrf2 family transcriptional regulator [Clostridia bacterium]|nr:Rrf2 family transcriptional regulator [Clostridia bacterium]